MAGRRDTTQSRSLRPACRHLEPREVCPLRVIHGRLTYTSELECSVTVKSEFDIFISSLNDHTSRAQLMCFFFGVKRSSVSLSVVLVVFSLPNVAPSAPCRRAVKVSRWWPLRLCLRHLCFLHG